MFFPEKLVDADAIASYIAELSDYEIDYEFVSEIFKDYYAVLTNVPITNLIEGDADHNIPDKKKQKKYNKLSSETMPPILVKDGVIQDGHHRYRSAIARGDVTISCYVVYDIDFKTQLDLSM